MMPRPDVNVRLDKTAIKSTVISNSAIYGIIRQRAREVIEGAIADDTTLKELVASVRNANDETRKAKRKALLSHLEDTIKWNERDASLMVEYASLDFGKFKVQPPDRSRMGFWPGFAIFTAWGGDVRERSVDLATGKVRPREVTVNRKELDKKPSPFRSDFDPTIYARVSYLDPKAKISESEKASCKAILKNLPVVFTFAPMNILHYQVKFPAKSMQKLTVSYSQYAYSDTRSPSSYQLAYVLHPASLWKEFGPINLEVAVPEGVAFRASVPCENGGVKKSPHNPQDGQFNIYKAELEQKTGELYLAVAADGWKRGKTQVALNSVQSKVQGVAQKLAK
jgi:hypothetical protein